MIRLALCAALLILVAMPAAADSSFQFSAAGNRTPDDPNVDGFRIVLFYGKNTAVSGFDLGIVSLSESERSSGFSMNLGIGKVTGSSSGLASGLVNVHSGEDTGVNAAFINHVKTMKSGANVGFVNVTDTPYVEMIEAAKVVHTEAYVHRARE